jgi:hypothetical protein
LNKKFLKLELDFDFILISITSPLKDYRLCYKINKAINLDLMKINDLEIIYSGLPPRYHSCYNYHIPDETPQYYVISNKGTEGFLIPELKETDYFVLIKDYIDEEDYQFFLQNLKRIPEIQVAVELDPRKLKSKENLIF